MRKFAPVAVAAAMLVLPAMASAKPTKADKTNASKECRAERTAMGEDNFSAKYGTFGKCVSQTTREEASERKQARTKAAKDCRAEGKKGRKLGKCVSAKSRENKSEADAEDKAETGASAKCRAEQKELGEEAFAQKYGTNKNKRNAFGKCVSGEAKQQGGDKPAENAGKPDDADEPDDAGKPDDADKPENTPAKGQGEQ